MSKSEKEPREFWLERSSFGVWVAHESEHKMNDWFDKTHVIEYSAYEKLKKENEMLRKEIKALNESLNCDGYY